MDSNVGKIQPDTELTDTINNDNSQEFNDIENEFNSGINNIKNTFDSLNNIAINLLKLDDPSRSELERINTILKNTIKQIEKLKSKMGSCKGDVAKRLEHRKTIRCLDSVDYDFLKNKESNK